MDKKDFIIIGLAGVIFGNAIYNIYESNKETDEIVERTTKSIFDSEQVLKESEGLLKKIDKIGEEIDNDIIESQRNIIESYKAQIATKNMEIEELEKKVLNLKNLLNDKDPISFDELFAVKKKGENK